MGRLLLACLVGIVGALIVHIGVIFAMPRVAEDNAWARLTRLMPEFRPTIVSGVGSGVGGSAADPSATPFGFMDPAFTVSACRFSVDEGPVALAAQNGGGFWSASIVARSGDNVYSINERLAPAGRLSILVGTQGQLDEARAQGILGGEDFIPVAVTASDFYLTFRVLVEGRSQRPNAERLVGSLSCDVMAPDA